MGSISSPISNNQPGWNEHCSDGWFNHQLVSDRSPTPGVNPKGLKNQNNQIPPPKTNGVMEGPQNDGPWKKVTSLQIWQFLVSMLDFWAVICDELVYSKWIWAANYKILIEGFFGLALQET